jgi:hypothetical protein
MLSSDLIRWSGLAAIVAGALLAVASLFDLMYFSPEPLSEVAQTSSYLFQQMLDLLGALLLLIGLAGLYARQSPAAGALGLVGFLIAFVMTVLTAGFSGLPCSSSRPWRPRPLNSSTRALLQGSF